ncbi:hypothetical protein [Helcococcus massiliensis]|uniref:hypothetical protein n=1 Tax=Helcococcus massiliensis TaxID=2040290 RepID=UPI000CDF1EC4|nr:hypothetical protein [Helcococcus massiliensis]
MLKNKKIKLLFILMACFMLTACGIQAKDDLNIDGNFKGKRIINISLDKETLDRVNGGNDSIKKFLNDYIESPFTYEIKKEEENLLNFDLSFEFNDIGEYKTIVKNLYEKSGKSFEDEINFLYSDGQAIFSKGIEFEDSSDIKVMLGYLEQKLVDEGLIKEADISNIWKSVEKNVTVNDEEIVKDSYTRAAYNNIEYTGPYQHMISISKSNLSDNYNMRIRLAFKNKNLEQLKSDWKEKLFDKNLVTNIEPIKNDDITIEVFDVENKDLSEIEKVLEKLFGNKVSLSIDSTLDKRRLVKVFKIEQTIAGDNNSKSNYEFIYYADPLSVEKHIKDMNKSNIEEKYLSSDNLEYVKLEEEFPIVFDKLSIVTKISKNSLSRSLTVSKDNDYNKELVNDFLISFLDEKGIKYKNNESYLTIEYSGDEFLEINSKLFTTNPNVESQSLGFFKDLINYSEDSSLININFNTIEYSYKYPILATETRQVENIFTTNNNWINAHLNIEVYKISSIIILFILLLALIVLIFLARRKMKKENKTVHDYLSKGKETFNTTKEKAKEAKSDIEDKVNEKTSIENIYDENNINIDKVLEDLIDSINQDEN